MKYAMGVDVGGTKTTAALISETGELIGDIYKGPTRADRSTQEVEQNIADPIRQALENADIPPEDILGIGMGLPGPLDAKAGLLLTPNNLPSLHNYPVQKRMEQRFGLPVKIDNDANVFALGEAIFGHGRGSNILIGLTLGTGFGCGIVIDQKIFEGATGTAGEIWLSPYGDSMFEEYISGRGLARMYEKYSGERVIGPEIESRARLGQEAAIQAWEEFGRHLGIIISHMVNFLDPDAVVIGGSISHAFDLFGSSLRKALFENINPRPAEHVKIFQSKLGEQAAMFGAAGLVFSDRR
ncbi:MAG: ROK family protein [Calditrichaeota bacterium]|nr:ROK family protein [Calditrichota bacterium]